MTHTTYAIRPTALEEAQKQNNPQGEGSQLNTKDECDNSRSTSFDDGITSLNINEDAHSLASRDTYTSYDSEKNIRGALDLSKTNIAHVEDFIEGPIRRDHNSTALGDESTCMGETDADSSRLGELSVQGYKTVCRV